MKFYFSSRRRHTRYWRDWSSDVCSSDLGFDAGSCCLDSSTFVDGGCESGLFSTLRPCWSNTLTVSSVSDSSMINGAKGGFSNAVSKELSGGPTACDARDELLILTCTSSNRLGLVAFKTKASGSLKPRGFTPLKVF